MKLFYSSRSPYVRFVTVAAYAGVLELNRPHVEGDRLRFDGPSAVPERYQDLFELTSRTLVVPAALANIVHRGDPRAYCDHVRRSPRDASRRVRHSASFPRP